MTGEQLLYAGIALVIMAVLGGAVAAILLRLRWSKIKRDLEKDYGPWEK